MHLRHLLLPCLVTFTLFQGCTPASKNIGDTLDTDGDETLTDGDESDGHSSDGGETASTGVEATAGTTSTAGDSFSTSGDSETIGTSTTAVGSDVTSDTDGTTGEHAGFDRFTLRNSAGPCPPESDCDGYIQLTSERMLRLEEFGEVGDPVIEVEVSEEDYVAAVEVFTAAAFIEFLLGPIPMCMPPTDVFERMELTLDGQVFDKPTTACKLPPVDAARDTAESLRTKYLP